MPDPRPCRRTPRRPAPGPEALEHLEVIRQTMERSTTFTAVSGWGYCAMGATALVAAPIALRQATIEAWIAVWLAEALVAVTLSQCTAKHPSKIRRYFRFPVVDSSSACCPHSSPEVY